MMGFLNQGIYNDKENNIRKQRKKIVHETLPEFDPGRVQCYLEFTHGFPNDDESKKVRGTIIIEVFDQEVPFTAENFRVMCTGEMSS